MVLPLVDEDRPKCYLCHKGFEDIESLRSHIATSHKESAPAGGDDSEVNRREPAPGDVTIF